MNWSSLSFLKSLVSMLTNVGIRLQRQQVLFKNNWSSPLNHAVIRHKNRWLMTYKVFKRGELSIKKGKKLQQNSQAYSNWQAWSLLCLTEEKLDVSGPIRSIKMCSCVQCAMQEKSVCCRAIPCLAHMEQEPDPLHPGHPPPPLSAWPLVLSLLVALNKDGPGQCSEILRTA
jgi:hypothetical protein